jgi:hypothetical protein
MRHTRIIISTIVAVVLYGSAPCMAQHAGDIFNHDVEGRLVTGSADPDSGMVTMGTRVYSGVFDLSFAVNDPGWNSLGAGSPKMPAGAQALPPNSDLEWDFLPMKIDGTIANLFYWDGTGDVAFGALPAPGYEFGLQAESSNFVLVRGDPQLVPGEVIDDTDSLGGIHVHRFWFLDDGEDATNPVDGVYLASLRTRMDTLDRSAPFYILFRTLTTDPAALTSAVAWAEARVDVLAPDFAADLDGDLDVDGDDFLTWQRGSGTMGGGALQIAGDANFDDAVGAADLAVWQSQYGWNLSNFVGTSSLTAAVHQVPEPSSGLLQLTTIAASLRLARRPVRSRLGALGTLDRLWYRCRN